MSKQHTASLDRPGGTYVARVGDREIARSREVLILNERNGDKIYPPVIYFPLADVDGECLSPSDHSTYCPLKGSAGYYSLRVDGTVLENAAWYYPEPFDDVAPIAGHVAFYRDKVAVSTA